MSWRWQTWNLRNRLTTLIAITVFVALGLVFAFISFLVRDQALSRRFSELRADIQQISTEWNTPDTLSETQEDFPGLDITVFDSNGTLVSTTTKHPPKLVEGPEKQGDTVLYGFRRGDHVFVGTTSWAETEAGLHQLELVLGLLWLPLTALVASVAWYGGGLVLRPVSELVSSAQKLSANNDKALLETSDGAEFAELADSLNQLIQRVRHAAAVQEQFASDAAHELRTPLALLRTRIEVNLQKDRTPEDHVTAQKAMLAQIDRLSSIVAALLSSARQETSESRLVEFGEAVKTAINDWCGFTQWPGERLDLQIENCSSTMSHDEVGIVLRNILDNAARHSPPDTPIKIRVTHDADTITLTVKDEGPGLTPEEMSLAFDRFYRSDAGRNRQAGGAGIGLAVVKRIVEIHKGHVDFEPTTTGALLKLTLPSGPHAQDQVNSP